MQSKKETGLPREGNSEHLRQPESLEKANVVDYAAWLVVLTSAVIALVAKACTNRAGFV